LHLILRSGFLSLNKHTIGHTPVQKAAYLLKKLPKKKQKNKETKRVIVKKLDYDS
jgi:hypothetical protein